MRHIPDKALASCALLGCVLTVAACGPASSSAAPGSPGTSGTSGPGTATAPASARSAPAATAVPSAATATQPTVTQPAVTQPTVTEVAPSTPPLPGVLADCIKTHHTLRTEPATIVLACADDGIGLQNMTWTSWTASAATGQGRLWENLCQPSCAAGKTETYPVAVRLSAVKPSSYGPWFSQLTVTWEGNRPPNQTPDTMTLPAPIR